MKIADAMEVADSGHCVLFLLTAYVEALRHYQASRSALHPQVIGLPLGGREDITARLQLLHDLAHRDALAEKPLIEEAIEVFAAASCRLGVLEADGVWHAAVRVRQSTTADGV